MNLEGKTIALAVARTGAYYAKPVLRGASHALTTAGARVVTLTGQEWSALPQARNAVYDLLNGGAFDGGIVLGGTLFHEQGSAEHFRERYRDIPLTSIGTVLPYAPAIMADNASGVRNAVLHLAGLGRRRIAFVRGPMGNSDAAERYRGYREGLERAGLPLDPDLIAPGAFVLLSGTRAVQLLLDERGACPDAIVAANDESARGTMEELQRRGVVIPDDIAVVGFDDVADGELCKPKLTTVGQPLVEQGIQAAVVLAQQLNGEQAPERITLDAQLVYRDSCGGRSRGPAPPTLEPLLDPEKTHAWMDGQFPQLWAWLRARAGWTSLDESAVRDAVTALLGSHRSAAEGSKRLEVALGRTLPGEAWRWFRGLEGLTEALLPSVGCGQRHAVAQRMESASRQVNEAIIADRIRENHLLGLQLDFHHQLIGDLVTTTDLPGMLERLRLNLQSYPEYAGCHLALHDEEGSWSRLVMSSTQLDATPRAPLRFPTRTLLPRTVLPARPGVTLCAAPLSDSRASHGLLVLEAPLSEALSVGRLADRVAAWLDTHSRVEQQSSHQPRVRSLPERIGPYVVRKRIGSGGMATVYLAETQVAGIPRPVAIKLMHPHLQSRTWAEQFVEEARITAAIRHPNVVQLLELGEHDGGMYLVMDYINGPDLGHLLAHWVQSGPGLSVGVSGRILVDALAGLAAAHDLTDADGVPVNLVHRDISVQNILVGSDGVTRITDFGIARHNSSEQTKTGVIKGKLRYMSPEQILGDPLDRRTDVWSMGVVAWEMFAGRPMYAEEGEAAVLRKILEGAPPLPSHTAGVDRLASIVDRALCVDTGERFASALAFRSALIEVYREIGGLADSEEVAQAVRRVPEREAPTLAPPRRMASS